MSKEQLGEFIHNELVTKVKIASTVKLGNFKRAKYDSNMGGTSVGGEKYKNLVLAIGASTGGTEAICSVLVGLEGRAPGIVITQHMPPGFTKMFADRLNNQTKFNVSEGKTGDVIRPGNVYIAPGDKQMKVVKVGGNYQIECSVGPKVSGHCPSVDVLFESVASACGKNAIGVILTGMGADGAKGLLKMRQHGAITVGQDEESCMVYGMPKVAKELGGVMYQASLKTVPEKVHGILHKF